MELVLSGDEMSEEEVAPILEDQDEYVDEEEEVVETLAQREKEEAQGPLARHVLAIMGFLGFVNVYAMRVNLSVAMVAMVSDFLLSISYPSLSSLR